ncbi:TM145-like protein [Mya arenaria]|uniref:TM145-like protein n=1 Tax=Mya arenaria TaxID=6604 RepID=A0ABY7E9Q7_MYAAR|nr:TM145-like protein [Mya arenaria]
MNNVFLTSVICLFLLTPSCNGKWAEGEIDSLEDWLFITRFCFLSKKGTLQFEFQYPVNCTERESVLKPENNQAIVLLEGHGAGCSRVIIDGVEQYDCSEQRSFRSARERWWYIAVSHCNPQTSCQEKVDVAKIENGQRLRIMPFPYNTSVSIQLLYTYVNCEYKVIGGVDSIKCNDDRYFQSTRERWWYMAISRCHDRNSTGPVGIKLKYKIHMTNAEVGDYLHREYSADEFYIMPIDVAFLIVYVLLSALVIVCAVFLRNRQLWHTTYKMYMVSVFLWTFYLFLMSMAYGVYGNDGNYEKLQATKYAGLHDNTREAEQHVHNQDIRIFDPGLVLYLYESPPGYVMIVMRIIGYAWFCYAIFFTLKHYPEKGSFYHPFFIFFTLWYVLTRPQAANKNFPYHVRTTQIGIMQNVPHQVEGAGGPIGDGSFGGHAYAMSNPMQGSSSGPDLTNLFVTSQTKSVPSGETQLNNNSSRFSQPEPEYTQFPSAAPSAPPAYQSQSPPSYQDMFTARQSMSS